MHKYHINIVVSGGSYIIRGGRDSALALLRALPGGNLCRAGPGSIDFDNIRESKLQIGSEKIQRLQPLDTRFC